MSLVGNRESEAAALAAALAAAVHGLQEARSMLTGLWQRSAQVSDGPEWRAPDDVDSYFDKLVIKVAPCCAKIVDRYRGAFRAGASLDACYSVLKREHLSGEAWRDEVDIFAELFPHRKHDVWRVPGRARRSIRKRTRRGLDRVPIETSEELIATLDWIRNEIKIHLGERKSRLRKKRLRPAARALDGVLILVRNGSAPGVGTFRFSYSIMAGHVVGARAIE